jgi:hypothetical protein
MIFFQSFETQKQNACRFLSRGVCRSTPLNASSPEWSGHESSAAGGAGGNFTCPLDAQPYGGLTARFISSCMASFHFFFSPAEVRNIGKTPLFVPFI